MTHDRVRRAARAEVLAPASTQHRYVSDAAPDLPLGARRSALIDALAS
jgi:hypothetical protein